MDKATNLTSTILYRITIFCIFLGFLEFGNSQTIIRPNKAFTQLEADVHFEWNPCVSAIQYEIETSTSSTFIGATSFLVSNTDTIINLTQNSYFWRVRCISGAGTGPLSSAGDFSVLNIYQNNLKLWVAADTGLLLSNN